MQIGEIKTLNQHNPFQWDHVPAIIGSISRIVAIDGPCVAFGAVDEQIPASSVSTILTVEDLLYNLKGDIMKFGNGDTRIVMLPTGFPHKNNKTFKDQFKVGNYVVSYRDWAKDWSTSCITSEIWTETEFKKYLSDLIDKFKIPITAPKDYNYLFKGLTLNQLKALRKSLTFVT